MVLWSFVQLWEEMHNKEEQHFKSGIFKVVSSHLTPKIVSLQVHMCTEHFILRITCSFTFTNICTNSCFSSHQPLFENAAVAAAGPLSLRNLVLNCCTSCKNHIHYSLHVINSLQCLNSQIHYQGWGGKHFHQILQYSIFWALATLW